MLRSLLIAAWVIVASAQKPTPAIIEVASLKPYKGDPFASNASLIGCRRTNSALFECNAATLRAMLVMAYGFRPDQIKGPSWLATDRFSLSARVRDGVATPDFLTALQDLLTQRFGIVSHKEAGSAPMYELTIAKGGSKLKAVDPAQVSVATMGVAASSGNASAAPPGAAKSRSMPPIGTIAANAGQDGSRASRGLMTMPQLVNFLSSHLRKPVLDKTGLTGTYEIDLEYATDAFDPNTPALQAVLAEEAHGSQGGSHMAVAASPLPSLLQAVQSSLGLKLEAKRLPVEVFVIDKALRTPSDN